MIGEKYARKIRKVDASSEQFLRSHKMVMKDLQARSKKMGIKISS